MSKNATPPDSVPFHPRQNTTATTFPAATRGRKFGFFACEIVSVAKRTPARLLKICAVMKKFIRKKSVNVLKKSVNVNDAVRVIRQHGGVKSIVKHRSAVHLASRRAVCCRHFPPRERNQGKSPPPIAPISVFGGGVRCATMITTVKPHSIVHLAARRLVRSHCFSPPRENGENRTLKIPPYFFFWPGRIFPAMCKTNSFSNHSWFSRRTLSRRRCRGKLSSLFGKSIAPRNKSKISNKKTDLSKTGLGEKADASSANCLGTRMNPRRKHLKEARHYAK